MNKYQEALEWLCENSKLTQFNVCQSQWASETLHELVDRTTPQKPINKHVLKQFGICPSCNADVNIRYHVVACGKCGKYLDWSNDGPTK